MVHEMGNQENYEYGPHRVAIPPSKPFFKGLKSSLKETFFPDDPFRQFKNQSSLRRLVLGLQYFVPILEWAPRYTFAFFKADLIAGITIASLAVPQGISYANLANLPPLLGLCKYYSKTNYDIIINIIACLVTLVYLLKKKQKCYQTRPYLFCYGCIYIYIYI